MSLLLYASRSLSSAEGNNKRGRIEPQLLRTPKPGNSKRWPPQPLQEKGVAQRGPATLRIEAQGSIEGLASHHQVALVQIVKPVRNERTAQHSWLSRLNSRHNLLEQLVQP
jgi:hypothetical protein